MRRVLILFASLSLMGAAPSRQHAYVSGEVIEPSEVTENEDAIFSYLQAGVDTYANSSVTEAALQSGSVTTSKLGTGAVTTTVILNGTILNEDINASAAISASKLADNEIDQEELAATITFSDGDLIDFSNINTSSTSEGIILPQATDCSSGTAEGQICWDTNGDFLSVGTSSAAVAIGTGGTPALTLSTSNSAGSATTFIRTDDTIAAFDATAPTNLGYGDAAATGSAAVAARRDHAHGGPVAPAWEFVESLTLSGSSTATSTLPTDADWIMLVFENSQGGGPITLTVNGSPSSYEYVEQAGATLTERTAQSNYLLGQAGGIGGVVYVSRDRSLSSNRIPIVAKLAQNSIDSAYGMFGHAVGASGDITVITISTSPGSLSGDLHVFKLTQQ